MVKTYDNRKEFFVTLFLEREQAFDVFPHCVYDVSEMWSWS